MTIRSGHHIKSTAHNMEVVAMIGIIFIVILGIAVGVIVNKNWL